MIILFLYTEISTYTEACLKALSCRAEAHMVKYPLNKEAPFSFSEIKNCTYYDRSQYSYPGLLKLSEDIGPDILIVSGWMDNEYIKIAEKFKGKIPVVLTMDNYWLGTVKQQVLRVISPFFLKPVFSHIWVTGKPQLEYAKKLGFKNDQIKTGFYSADVDLYNQLYELYKDKKKKDFPKRFLYVGRYVAFKNMQLMCEAFIDAINEKKAEWELWCIGTGELWDQRIEHPQIKHIGFVQPKDMASYVEQTGVFALPSTVENWGVVVHEFAAAGFPLACSTGIGAASEFLQKGKNGFTFSPYKKEELKNVFIEVMSSSAQALNKMGEVSHELANTITPEIWANTIFSFKLK